MVKRLQYTFENKGDVILADHVLARDFLREAGRHGFGIAPTTISAVEGSKAGSKFRRSRRGSRTIDMPISIFGEDRDETEAKLRRFARLLQDDESAPKLVATYPGGERVYAEIHYSAGADPTYGTDTDGLGYCRWPLVLWAPSPYWTDEAPISYSIESANQGRGLLPNLSQLQLSSSQTMGSVHIENTGDVEAFPVWQIRGPGDNFRATRFDGKSYYYKVPIASGETITVDTVRKTVTDQNGENKYINLDTAPKLFSIPSGGSDVSVVMENSSPGESLVSLYFNPRRELIF